MKRTGKGGGLKTERRRKREWDCGRVTGGVRLTATLPYLTSTFTLQQKPLRITHLHTHTHARIYTHVNSSKMDLKPDAIRGPFHVL